jgi:DNA-binding response OmpR family regulator
MQDAIIACPCCGQKTAVKRPIVDLTDNTIVWAGGRIDATGQEAEFISILAKSFGRAVAYDAIISGIYGGGDEPQDAKNILSIHKSHLRKRLLRIGLQIQNVWGKGYALEAVRQESASAAA